MTFPPNRLAFDVFGGIPEAIKASGRGTRTVNAATGKVDSGQKALVRLRDKSGVTGKSVALARQHIR
jgi:hypothetical protein